MQILTTPQELAAQCRAWRAQGENIALVPTMGYYHAGHEDLMTHARGLVRRLVVSLFVNPAQFGPGEDLEAYPRDAERDAAIAERHGADALFMPEPGCMYMPDHATWVEVPELARGLCGQSRPIHFRGVCTVVLKLFLLTGADVAVFGQKDWQQQAIIRRMVRDLNVPTRIEARPTVREADGLAKSSRNTYLSADERQAALVLSRAVAAGQQAVAAGERDAAALKALMREVLDAEPLARIDYLEAVDGLTMQPVERIGGEVLVAMAVYIGSTRLIDNFIFEEQPCC